MTRHSKVQKRAPKHHRDSRKQVRLTEKVLLDFEEDEE